jgi:hypothetical protein
MDAPASPREPLKYALHIAASDGRPRVAVPDVDTAANARETRRPMVLKDPRGRPRSGLIGCGAALLFATPIVGWQAIKNWREGLVLLASSCAR